DSVGPGGEALHAEAERLRRVELGLLIGRAARAVPPGVVNVGPVRRVHEADHRLVDLAGEVHLDVHAHRRVADNRNFGNLRVGLEPCAEPDPDIALLLTNLVGVGANAAGVEVLPIVEGRNRSAAPTRRESPAVIVASDFITVEAAARQRQCAMGADVAQPEHLAVPRAADHDRLAEEHTADHLAGLQAMARHHVVPGIAQRSLEIQFRRFGCHGDLMPENAGSCNGQGRGEAARSRSIWRSFATLRLWSAKVSAKTWPPVPSATKY